MPLVKQCVTAAVSSAGFVVWSYSTLAKEAVIVVCLAFRQTFSPCIFPRHVLHSTCSSCSSAGSNLKYCQIIAVLLFFGIKTPNFASGSRQPYLKLNDQTHCPCLAWQLAAQSFSTPLQARREAANTEHTCKICDETKPGSVQEHCQKTWLLTIPKSC